MTAIVALNGAEGFTFGADSAAMDIDTFHQDVTDDGKLFENGPMIFGYCGSGRMGQLLEFSLSIPRKKRSQTGLRYMTTAFINAVRDCLKAGGWAGTTSGAIHNDKEGEEVGGTFIVGFEKQLYIIDEDYQVLMPKLPFTAIGCGGPYALGAMYAEHLNNTLFPASKSVRHALLAAERYNGGVRRPFAIRHRSH